MFNVFFQASYTQESLKNLHHQTSLFLVLALSGSILVAFMVLSIYLLSWRHKNKKRSRIDEDVSGTEGGGFELQDY